MKKLLNKTLGPFILYALVILLCSIPAYIYLVNKIWVNELDEHHRGIKSKIEKGFNDLNYAEPQLSNTINLWNSLQHGVQVKPGDSNSISKENLYTINKFDPFHNEEEQFRGLSSYITINQKSYLVTIETNMEEMDETIIAIASVAIGFFLLLLLGFIILNRRISKQVWKPFYKTIEKLEAFDLKGNASLHLEKSNTVEFEQLNQAVTKLVEANISVYNQQKEFTENASHELQTPLSIIKSKLDLLLQYPALSKEQAEMIESINIPLSRASRINKNLLLLAKIENQQFDEKEWVNIGELLNMDIELFSDQIESKNITIHKDFNMRTVVQTNKSLVEILLANLLLNSIRHSAEKTQIKINLNDNQLSFANTGDVSLNKESLFKRFISTSDQNRSSGLGLAIVKQICNRYKWQIIYSFDNGFHVFTIKL